MGLRQSRWGLLAIGLLLTSVQANGASRVVFVQPIQVRGDDGTGPANPDRVLFEAAADKILAQADVELRFLPWRTYDSSAAQAITTSAQFNSLIDGSYHGQHANKNVCNMWFVQTIAGGSCGAPR